MTIHAPIDPPPPAPDWAGPHDDAGRRLGARMRLIVIGIVSVTLWIAIATLARIAIG